MSNAAVSEARLHANRANAQLSSGPVTAEGKAKSSQNALRTGLTGRTVLLPTEDAVAYEAHIASFQKRHSPATDEETELVQSLADAQWRLMRIPSLEAGIYAVGRMELAESFPNAGHAERKQLIEAKILIAYERQLRNLSTQEARLRRQYEKDTERLAQLQKERKQAALDSINSAAWELIECKRSQRSFDPERLGFVFSTEQIEYRAAQMFPEMFPHIEVPLRKELRKPLI
jgi:hypothetical protein